MKESYHTIRKQVKVNEQELATFLSKNGPGLLPVVELIEQSRMACDQHHRESTRRSAHPHSPRHQLAKWLHGPALDGFGIAENGDELPQDHGLLRTLDPRGYSKRIAVRHSTDSGVVISTQPPLETFNHARDILGLNMPRSNWFRYKHILATILLSASTLSYAQYSRPMELRRGWELISAEKLADSGAAISRSSYVARKWYPIHRMPATVLEILREDNVYPNLFYGMNMLTEVPPDLYKQDWWYRTSFHVPAGEHTYWIDFPGINYRANIWLNGHLIADNKQVVGMYADHHFNVTHFIHPGQTNVLAVKVTPERLMPYVNGVELGSSWSNWINVKYFEYHGPLNIHDLPTTGLTATYVAPEGGAAKTPLTMKVTIASASTAEVTLKAAVSAGQPAVSSGSAVFLLQGKPIGRSIVDANGIATLKVNQPEDVSDIERFVRQPSFISDRNAGIWKPVTLYITGAVRLSNALVDTELPLPATNPAKLTVYTDVTNGSSVTVRGDLYGEITRPGKQSIHISQPVTLAAGETREISFLPRDYPHLIVHNPDLWWPYTMGTPALYDLHLSFVGNNQTSDTESIRFGIREVTQHRDHDEQFPSAGKGGSFYLQINGRNFLIRGAAYTPDLLYRYDPKREATAIAYAKDMGLNMLRWESKMSSEHMLELADEAGMPVMYGWMCCAQWELWPQWSAEDQRVAPESLRSEILALRSHPSVFIWANGSDGLPPPPIRKEYHHILTSLHWQNAVVDTVSSDARAPNGEILWDGIHMKGPYTWRPPSYWFSGRYVGARGAVAEQGDNEDIPPYESLKKFIPPDKLWPINEYWFFHAGAHRGSGELLNARRELNRRYGPSSSAKEFAKKAQLGSYEDTRAQFEDFAANGWANHKMTIYWMLDSVWPSFYAHLYDYYLKPGGSYFGAKKGLRPLSVVFDSYATGDHTKANITVVNHTPKEQDHLRVRVRIYDIEGKLRLDRSASNIRVASGGAVHVLTLPCLDNISSVYFVRCELFDGSGKRVVQNVYWQSTTDDEIGGYAHGDVDDNPPIDPKRAVSWANFTALNTMPKVRLQMHGTIHRSADNDDNVVVTLHNTSRHIAFFERLEVTMGKDGDEILPIIYNDNYITVFPGETARISSTYKHALLGKDRPWLKLEGYNTVKEIAPIY
ncbi:MAG: glycosyl hydrolase 2 galactose-binding domain-containing protein [Acidobacteriaceae bacterium]